MKTNYKITIFIVFLGGVLFMSLIGGKSTKRQEIEYALKNFTELFPTDNISDFYDMEGFRDSNFNENDKGSWYFTNLMIFDLGDGEQFESINLKVDRNTRKADGYYEVFHYDGKDKIGNIYYFKLENNMFTFKNELNIIKPTKEVIERIENFKFGVEYLNFQSSYLKNLKLYSEMYNANVPMYDVKYKLVNDDINLKKFYKQYPNFINLNVDAILSVEGSGLLDKEGSYDSRSYSMIFKKEGVISSVMESIRFTKSDLWENRGEWK